ncbi:MAG: NAD(P)/FAD-dependent oxidoreductase [Bdellovibrionota bacterium]
MSRKTEVLVIGAGVVGLACARDLALRGASVTVIDKGELGNGCSYGNAGWITPCFALPLPMPGMLLKSVGWLLNPESPLYIHPQPSLLLARWLLRFLLSMNRKHLKPSVAALTELSKFSLEAYQELDRELPGRIHFEKNGLLLVTKTDGGMRAALTEMRLMAGHGISGRELNRAEVRKLEPAVTGEVLGGVYFPDEAHAEPMEVVRALAESATRAGAKLQTRTEVFDFEIAQGLVRAVRTTRGTIAADQFVLATGSWSTRLARRLGINVPVLGGKGYAIVTAPLEPSPKIPLMLVERKIAVTPRQGSVRLAGTLELVNQDDAITPRRVDAIVRGSREFLNVPEHPEIREVWRGLRPCTPDGVPIIGPAAKLANLLIVAGHQMLGLQSAPGTGRLAADLLLRAQPSFDPFPYRATRF